MADILLDTQSPSATPAAGQGVIYFDSVSKLPTIKNDAGFVDSLSDNGSFNTADVVANAADTYLTGSMLTVPGHLLQAGTIFRWRFVATKTGAGIATPIWSVRVGTAGSTADTARLTFTGPAQTGVIDAAQIDITVLLRNTGAAGIMAGGLAMTHNLAATGFANQGDVVLQVTSSGFDTTVASTKVGVSVNPGSVGVWTHQIVMGNFDNI